eukprot:6214538-Pleurochrysis_carterae.AAC.4
MSPRTRTLARRPGATACVRWIPTATVAHPGRRGDAPAHSDDARTFLVLGQQFLRRATACVGVQRRSVARHLVQELRQAQVKANRCAPSQRTSLVRPAATRDLGAARGRIPSALQAAHGTGGEPTRAMRVALDGTSDWCRSLRSCAHDSGTRDNHSAQSSERRP